MLFRAFLRDYTTRVLREGGRFAYVGNSPSGGLERANLPALRVWTPSDTEENLSIGVPELRGTATLNIQVVADGSDDATGAAQVDALCEAIMLVLLEDPHWLRLMNWPVSIDTALDYNSEGEMRTASALISMTLQYGRVFVTRINDYLDTVDGGLVPPNQPEPPPGQERHRVRFQLDFER